MTTTSNMQTVCYFICTRVHCIIHASRIQM